MSHEAGARIERDNPSHPSRAGRRREASDATARGLARRGRRAARADRQAGLDRGIVSVNDWRRKTIRFPLATAQLVLLLLLVIAGLLPVLWLMKAALTPTQDTLTQPLALFPHGITWSNLAQAFGVNIKIQDFFLNTGSPPARGSCRSWWRRRVGSR
ncbi:MAG: hypothetical protein WDM88_13595 [Galbitalea sp.]